MKATEAIKTQQQNKKDGQAKILSMINEKIIAKLEAGVNPWRKPWAYPTAQANAETMAVNYFTNRAYSGINQVILDAGYYLTFNEVKKLGGNVKKGAEGSFVVYSAPKTYYTKEQVKDKDGNIVVDDKGEPKEDWVARKGFILAYYYVFRLEDCENIREIKRAKTKVLSEDKSRIDHVDEIVSDYCKRAGVILRITNSDSAYYRPLTHEVIAPKCSQYKGNSEFYSTLFHELTHSTGHSTLLNREGIANGDGFGTEKYSFEELIAEIGSCYCCNWLGLATEKTDENSAAYLQSWAKRLRSLQENTEDKKTAYFILKATSEAAKAFKLILNIQEQEQENESEAKAA